MMGLDIGCGKSKHLNCVGLDMNGALDGVDVVHEITYKKELPFPDNNFNQIFMYDVIEHVDNISWLLSEVHRVSIPGAIAHIHCPHSSGRNAYGDVTHRRYLSLKAFNHFDPNTPEGDKYKYYASFGRYFPFAKKNLELDFQANILGPILYKILGESIYERRISNILPISSMRLDLIVIK
jgi:hypothetical protein